MPEATAHPSSREPLLRPALALFMLLTLLTGAVYPLMVTLLAGALFPDSASGSLILREGQAVGSRLIGQPFDDLRYFWSRPSATAPVPYNAAASSGSNLGPLNPALSNAMAARASALRAAHPEQTGPIPVDLVTASASGLDPHITPAAARFQVQRVARERGLAASVVEELVAQHVEQPFLGFLGEGRVNVLQLNLALDALVAGALTPGSSQ